MNKKKIFIGLGILLLILIMVISFVFIKKGKEPELEQDNNVQLEENPREDVKKEKKEIKETGKASMSEVITFEREDGLIRLYGEDGRLLDSFEIKKLFEESSEDDLLSNTFTVFRTINNELLFRDNTNNSLVFISAEKGKIVSEILIEDSELRDLNNVFIDKDNNIYLTYSEKQIIEVIESETKKTTKYKLGHIPDYVFVNEEKLYYTTENQFIHYDLEKDSIENIINIGASVLDIHINQNIAYVINSFGEGKDNSVLIKINLESLLVEGIMELKGLKSKFIGVEGSVAYIRQSNSIKEIDLKALKPLTSRDREEGVPVLVKNKILYSYIDGKIQRVNLMDNSKDYFEAEGFSIHIIGNP